MNVTYNTTVNDPTYKTHVMKKLSLLLIFLTASIISSCAILQENDLPHKGQKTKRTDYVINVSRDSLNAGPQYQCDNDVKMLQLIKLASDNTYILLTTKEEALEIGIPEAKFDYYEKLVEQLNRNK